MVRLAGKLTVKRPSEIVVAPADNVVAVPAIRSRTVATACNSQHFVEQYAGSNHGKA